MNKNTIQILDAVIRQMLQIGPDEFFSNEKLFNAYCHLINLRLGESEHFKNEVQRLWGGGRVIYALLNHYVKRIAEEEDNND